MLEEVSTGIEDVVHGVLVWVSDGVLVEVSTGIEDVVHGVLVWVFDGVVDVVHGVLTGVSVGVEDVVQGVFVGELSWVRVYAMQEQAELTAVISPAQLLKSVGIAAAAVVVPEMKSRQNGPASAVKRVSIMFL